MTFEELSLIQPILDAVRTMGYTEPTPIQQQAILPALEGRDIMGCAQTGTGKTAAFALPILQHLAAKKNNGSRPRTRALVLAPTRELALQISENFTQYGVHLGIRHTVIFGGVSQKNQEKALKSGVDIVVATPGRLLDLTQQGLMHYDAIEHFVLDEADRMLDMGFINDIRKIIAMLPKQRQTLFFSATISSEIRELSRSMLINPVHLNVEPEVETPALVSQSIYYVRKENKRSLLKHLLRTEDIEHALVFTRTKHGADRVVEDLKKCGFNAAAIHGDKTQSAREKALNAFKSKTIRVLVATDIASRGIDVDSLSHVINFEIPEQAETYVHRIGRTGRAGMTGAAFSFCSADEIAYMRGIHKLTKQKIAVAEHPYA
jgi:ATP-dependent RNA helicase RhlE